LLGSASLRDTCGRHELTVVPFAARSHVLTLPWIFTHGDTKVLSEKKEGTRRFADDVIAKL
jgi:hypothetical protein